MGHLERRAGDFAPSPSSGRRAAGSGGAGAAGMLGAAGKMLVELAKGNGSSADPMIRQDLMRLHSFNEIARFTNLRLKAAKAAGKAPGPEANTAKLSMSRIVRLSREVGLRILGPQGTLHAYEDADREVLLANGVNPFAPMVTEMALFAPAPSIYGGTDEIQRNIIGERVLGLPKEPGPDKATPFRELPKNG